MMALHSLPSAGTFDQGYAAGMIASSLPARELIALFGEIKRKAREHRDGDPPHLCGWLFAAEPAVQRAWGEVLNPKRNRRAGL